MKFVFATNNAHKLGEVRKLAGDKIEILSLADIDCNEELPETAGTIEGNSLQKARYVKEKYGYDCFSDDTGLFVDALDGAPGVFSARYAGDQCNSEDNVKKLLREMSGVADRKAHFRTVITLCEGDGEPLQFSGQADGKIAYAPYGAGGFGYDPVFISDENGISFAEMDPEEKNRLSHRGKAIRKLIEHMKRYLVILGIILVAALNASAAITAGWKSHMPFDAWPRQVVETPERVYFTARTFEFNNGLVARETPSHSLFYYDKKGDEIISVNETSGAFGNAVTCIGYNATAKYLLVVYLDNTIDFIYDDGRIFNLQSLKMSSIQGKKVANSITFDSSGKRAYIAMSFGYVSLNDEKHEIADSRNYSTNIQSIAKCGENIVLCADNKIYYAPASAHRFSLDEYTCIENGPAANGLLPLDGNNFISYIAGTGSAINLFKYSGGNYSWEQIDTDPNIFCCQETPSGYTLTGNVRVFQISKSGQITNFARPEEDWRFPASTYNGTELWCLTDRKGIRSYQVTQGKFTLTRDFMRPNAPATYICSDIQYHPTFGMLAGSNGHDYAFSDFNQQTINNISSLKGGLWKEYGIAYTNPGRLSGTNNYFGVAIDPQNRNYIYRGSTLGGIMRINLTDPTDLLIMANPSNSNSGKDGFIKIVDDQAAWNIMCRFTTPRFTADGTMWTLYNNSNEECQELWYWSAADRAATTSAASYRPMKKIKMPELVSNNAATMITLSVNQNMVVIFDKANYGSILVYDHNGTPNTTADDRYVYMKNLTDQDGGTVYPGDINNFVEDPETGIVWVMAPRGVFNFNPATAFQNPNTLNRVKVARNDGTNLADYLLNEINVNNMCIDGEGRKWFCTSNGLVCTSRDGRTVLGEFTTDNSDLISNVVFDACYNPDNNSLLLATEGGLQEMFPSGSGSSSSSESSIRIYPNPVEPDYYGWVRIDNIADGSLVKITDARGGIVKELGPAQGGSVEWDVSGLNNSRVSTGVYYVMVSPGNNGDGNAQISKILVLN